MIGALHLPLAALDLREILILIVFVGIPVLRGIMEATKKKDKAPAAPRRPAPGDPDYEARDRDAQEQSGREMWERLLRGEVEEAGPPRRAEPPTQAPPRTPAPPIPDESWGPASPVLTRQAPPPVPDEEQLAEQLANENAALASRWGEEALTPVRLRSLEDGFDEPQETVSETEIRSPQAGAPRRFDLRQAVLASEILGPPVSLRSSAGGSTPPGLSE